MFKTLLLVSLGTIYGSMSYAKPTNHHSGKSLKIYPVEKINQNDSNDRGAFKECSVVQDQEPIFTADGFSWSIKAKPKPAVLINVDPKDKKALVQLSKKYIGKSIATCLGDDLLFISTVREELNSERFVVSFKDNETTDQLIKILSLENNPTK